MTSPPYWTLKQYHDHEGQLGAVNDYVHFLDELDRVWRECHRVLSPGGRLCIVVGDVCLSRRKAGRHRVVPLHSDITTRCVAIGFDNLAPIFWYKIANIQTEMERPGYFLGKPFEPNGIIKNDVEYILMLRKPGEYRHPTDDQRLRSRIPKDVYGQWYRQIWDDIGGASTRDHPAPYPLELADRLVRMFSFVGDTVLDPFVGTGTTTLAALEAERNSIGVEIDPRYLRLARQRLLRRPLPSDVEIHVQGLTDEAELLRQAPLLATTPAQPRARKRAPVRKRAIVASPTLDGERVTAEDYVQIAWHEVREAPAGLARASGEG